MANQQSRQNLEQALKFLYSDEPESAVQLRDLAFTPAFNSAPQHNLSNEEIETMKNKRRLNAVPPLTTKKLKGEDIKSPITTPTSMSKKILPGTPTQLKSTIKKKPGFF
eukprot:TRINITY_DN1339_c3_g2_i1.p1 TRINITY_DN1339_c3_g2~~TRINITY_DN1339_c3_g2_i1.p1  ORF type:complete len:123 (-),score=48.54 TRINITY_DN1339_c3_g2_i1:493-819(-)